MRIVTCKHKIIIYRRFVARVSVSDVLERFLDAKAARVSFFAVVVRWRALGPVRKTALAKATHAVNLIFVYFPRLILGDKNERGIRGA